ncbi:MAG: SdpI family protein [Lachnospiraceae bacterium]|nr:SdpI family protein [Lachnospiraceae bacterium]
MGFWIFMFIMNLSIPVILILIGLMLYKTDPGDINNYWGYRTKMSMINKDTWDFAHDYVGRLFCKYGKITLIIASIIFIPFIGQSNDVIGYGGAIIEILEIVPIFISIHKTEKALKATFDKEGNRLVSKL